ncbi:MAG: helix-turn-helix transcriptional regulator [Erythrobacter sp.]|nr:helix-turn-helix transcriptional regulator [Erythrobacter sp.]
MTDEPTEVCRVTSGEFSATILEWDWPEVVDYTSSQEQLTVEASLPPFAASATACFPDIAAADFCMMGSLFIRYPGQVVRARGPGGLIRLLRCELGPTATARLHREQAVPSLDQLKALLNIQSPLVRSTMDLIHCEMQLRSDYSPEAMAALARLLQIAVDRVLAEGNTACDGSGCLPDWQFRRIKAILQERDGRVTVDELAQGCGLSVRHLQRQFHRLTGRTVSDYVRGFWFERAKEMLAGEGMQIGEVAERLHFSSASAFSRAFRKQAGQTASQYRRRQSTRPLTAPASARAGAGRVSPPSAPPVRLHPA